MATHYTLQRDNEERPLRAQRGRVILSRLRTGLAAAVETHLKGRPPGVLLDFGCGEMPFRSLFEPFVAKTIAVDLPGNPRSDLWIGEDGRVPMEDERADVVFSGQVLEHALNPAGMLREIFRLMKPGGLLLLTTHGHWMYHPDPEDYGRWTSAGLRRLIRDTGLDVLEMEGVLGLAPTGLQLFQDAVLPKLPRRLRSLFVHLLQLGIQAADRLHTDAERRRDASVFIVVAMKPHDRADATSCEGSSLPSCTEPRDLAPLAAPPAKMAGQGPKVCVICPGPDVTSETFIRAHIERMPVRPLVLYGGAFPTMLEDGSPLSPRPTLPVRLGRGLARRAMGWPWNHFDKLALKRALRRHGVEVVLAEYGTTGASVMEVCEEAGLPLVVHFHGHDAYDARILAEFGPRYPKLFQQARFLIAVSQDMRRQLLHLGAPAGKIQVNPCGADAPLFEGASPAEAEPVFVAVGRFVDKKGPHLTLWAFAKALKAVPDIRLIMIGDGPLLESSKQLARSMGILGAVQFLGARPHGEVASVMKRARAFLQHSITPSHGDSEGTPVSVMEAQAAGLPVIATRHAGIPDVVVDGVTGRLVDEGDTEGIAQAIIQLTGDPELAAQWGRAGRDRILQGFSLDKTSLRLWEILIEAASSASSSNDGSSPRP